MSFRGLHRPNRLRRLHGYSLAAAALVTGGLLLSGCAGQSGAVEDKARAAGEGVGHAGPPAPRPELARAAKPVQAEEIPALGPRTRKQIPGTARQVVVVTGDAPDSGSSTVVLYTRDPVKGWQPVTDPWTAHNALRGWTADHHAGDLHSPYGVFGLTDAGGRKADPGTRLPYDREGSFIAAGTGFDGEPLAGAFDYVVAINYNHVPGRSPLDGARPMGANKGGGVWFHVDHGGPTHGCVSLPEGRMKELLGWLDPAKKPVVVMGDVSMLGR
ncbi:L,D-transpeptidase family protein [Streptomyces sp. NBC_01387]|uniref:L,D-transpeptidase family protein n=1 Tax=unclassified Streptomyces TaxID=2593676 RepID=UPI002DDAA972|nr:L,D-transpeptidase family protein [Streptomyces sp. NBC_01766]WSC21256.1 L,D-transpeptidase family protein [Streptomyces sp. NBC_01766]